MEAGLAIMETTTIGRQGGSLRRSRLEPGRAESKCDNTRLSRARRMIRRGRSCWESPSKAQHSPQNLSIFRLILLLVGAGLVLLETSSRTPSIALLRREKDSNVMIRQPGRCPELIEAAKYVAANFSNRHQWRVGMIQLVGVWDTPEKSETMERVFRHNQHLLKQNHGIDSMRITRSLDNMTHNMPPPFWKMGALQHACTNYDLVWLLDGDVIIMDPYARVEFLWAYHKQHYPEMELLLAHDWNGVNTGIIIANCSSPTLSTLLTLWQQVAIDLWQNNDEGVYLFHDQNTIHYWFNSSRWRRDVPSSTIWNDAAIARYPTVASQADAYTSAALKTRIRHTTQCALNTFPPEGWDATWEKWNQRQLFLYSQGHFLLHTAGVRGGVRFHIMNKYVSSQQENLYDKMQKLPLSLREAARAYLQTHDYNYKFEETNRDW